MPTEAISPRVDSRLDASLDTMGEARPSQSQPQPLPLVCSSCGRDMNSRTDDALSVIFVRPCACRNQSA
jgi:hypothetical protein